MMHRPLFVGSATGTMLLAVILFSNGDLPYVHGIVLHDGLMYLATDTSVYRSEIESDGTLAKLKTIIDDLPNAG